MQANFLEDAEKINSPFLYDCTYNLGRDMPDNNFRFLFHSYKAIISLDKHY
jgi:hypothetical protein